MVRFAMAQEIPPGERDQRPHGDPWMAFGYVVSGVFLYGLIGWLLDRWLDTTFLVAVGILLGAALGIYQTWARFRLPIADEDTDPSK
jgi:F0F1-type ATP synthase assembly protein I